MNSSRWLTIVFSGLLAITLPLSIFLVTRSSPGELRTKAARGAGGGEVRLFLKPAEVIIKAGQEMEFDVKIDTGDQVVGGLKMVLEYDPAFLSLVAEESGTAFTDLRTEKGPGQLTFQGEEDLLGLATVARLTFRGVRAGEVGVKVADDSLVWQVPGKYLGYHSAGARVIIE